MKYFKKVEGELVYLSPINADDSETYTQWLNDPAVSDGLGVSDFTYTVLNEREWIEARLKEIKAYHFAIVKQDGDELIGGIGFEDINTTHRTATIGVFVGSEENRGKGYGTQAVMLAVKYGFDVLNLNNISLGVYDFNERAMKSYIKAGFREYGRRRKAYYLNGEYYDIISMDILREDYYLLKNDAEKGLI